MTDVQWTVTEADGKVTTTYPKLPFQPALELTEKTPKNQIGFIQGWNQMRQRLLDLGQMETN